MAKKEEKDKKDNKLEEEEKSEEIDQAAKEAATKVNKNEEDALKQALENDEINKEHTISDAKFLEEGAKYKENNLIFTEEQKKKIKKEHEKEEKEEIKKEKQEKIESSEMQNTIDKILEKIPTLEGYALNQKIKNWEKEDGLKKENIKKAFDSPKVLGEIKKRIIVILKEREKNNNSVFSAIEIIHVLKIEDKVLDSPEVQKAAEEYLAAELNTEASLEMVWTTIRDLKIPEERISSSPEIQKAAEGAINKYLGIAKNVIQHEGKVERTMNMKYLETALALRNICLVPEESFDSPEIQKVAIETMTIALSRGDIYKFLEIKCDYNVPDKVLNFPKVLEAANEGIKHCFTRNRLLEIKKIFNIKDTKLEEKKEKE